MTTIDTQVLRAEPHIEIGALIESSAERLVEEWCQRALQEQPAARRVHSVTLQDHLPKLLRRMGRDLLQAGNSKSDTRRAAEPAEEHGVERWESGWSLTELVRDYQLLRLVIIEYLEKALCRALYFREVMAIGVFIDDAIASSIATYVASRDEELRESVRERATRLEQESRRKDEFMAMLAHELRNPLAPIHNSLQIMRAVLSSPQPAVATALDVAERQSKQLGRLVDDMLDLARIGQGQFELRTSKIDLATILERAAQASAPLVKARQHTLTVTQPSQPVALEADPDRLVQVICNLINNAAKYTEPQGHIWLSGESDDVSAVIRVRDDGMGIPAELVGRVFDLFMQVDGSRERAQGGMGIGLALVRRLVEQHGGSVYCQSEGPGLGSEFIVRLPLIPTRETGGSPNTLKIVEWPVPKA